MKTKLISISLLCLTVFGMNTAKAQNTFPASGAAGIGTTSPNGSSLLDVTSTTKGVLFPRMTKTQRNAIASPTTGLLIFQTDNTPGLYVYKNGTWSAVTTTNSVRGLPENLFIGNNTGIGNTTGTGNIALGRAALNGNPDRIENIAIGDSSCYVLGVGAIGNQAWYNTAVGSKSQRFSTTGTKNTSVGAYSLYNCVAGNDDVAIGYKAMFSNQFNHFCVAVGENALYSSKGDNNTAVGYDAGSIHTFSTECTFLGQDADQDLANSYINGTAVGSDSRITGNAMVRIGNSSVSSIGGFANFTNVSDGRYKKEIKENVPGLDFINRLKPVTYHLDVRGIRTFLHEGRNDENPEAKARIEKGIADKERILYSGFVAQDVERAAQESGYDFSGVDKPQNDNSLYGLRYAEFAVPLVKAVQELDKKNTDLENEIKELRSLLISNQQQRTMPTPSAAGKSSLEQNNPNPFTDKTTINFILSSDAVTAFIVIRNLNGAEMKKMAVDKSGSITLEGRELAQGTYTYSLEINGKSVDTKLMVITK